MKLTVLQENIEKGLGVVNNIISQKTNLPILSHVLIKTLKDKVNLCATDLETGIKVVIWAKIEKEGELVIPAKVLGELISSLPREKISLSVKELTLLVEAQNIKASIVGIQASEFPEIFGEGKELLIELEMKTIKQLVGRVYFAASTDEGRPALTGILLRVGKETDLIATDGYRLSWQKILASHVSANESTQPVQIIIPAKILKQIPNLLLSKEEGLVRIYTSKTKNQAIVMVGENMLVGRLVEGDFPPFEKIIPTSKSTSVVIDKDEFLKAVKICAIFARESANIIRLKLNKEGVLLSANSPQVGEDTVLVNASFDGEENDIAFNSRFLLEFLSNIDAQELVFEMTGPLNPGVFKIKDDDSFLHIIMPVRIQAESSE